MLACDECMNVYIDMVLGLFGFSGNQDQLRRDCNDLTGKHITKLLKDNGIKISGKNRRKSEQVKELVSFVKAKAEQ